MKGIDLTERQNKIWTETGERLAAGSEIRHHALQYYIQYRDRLLHQKMHHDSEDRIANLLQIAYFISQKNEKTFDLRGKPVTGVALSINEIIKKNNDFEDFIYHMKEMLKVITVNDKSVQVELDSCLKKFKFTLAFYHKFIKTIKLINYSASDPALFQSLAWLIFIICKQRLREETDLISSTCLIALTFIYCTKQCLSLKRGELWLKDEHYGGVLSKESTEHVFLEYFRLKDMAKYSEMEKFFFEQVQDLKTKTSIDFLFSDKTMEQVYRKVDYYYQKRLDGSSIDERHFLKERVNTTLNANRFTPFAARRIAHQTTRGVLVPNQILSHRVLSYDHSAKQCENDPQLTPKPEENRENTGGNLMKNLIGNRTPVRTPLIKATPVTNAMEMRNWVLEKSSYHKFSASQMPEILGKDEDTLKLINGLWKDLCLYEGEKKELTLSNNNTLLALSAEIVYLVIDREGSFENLVKSLELNWFSVWSKIDSVLKYDSRMPVSIKVHLLSLETTIISKKLWTSQNFSPLFSNQLTQRPENSDLDRLFKRVIHEIVYQIFFLSKKLEIKENSMNSIFLLCQFAIGEYKDLLHHRNLYHIIMCSCYAISKAHDLTVSFYSIMMAFQEMNKLPKEEYEELTEEIYVDEETVTDIISYYNSFFVKKIKGFLLQLKKQSPETIDISNRKNIINSPVKDLLSKNLMAMHEKNKSPLQTPFSQALMAYNESPLLKEKRIKNLANCIDGKRLLEKKETQSTLETKKQTSMLINKKFKNCKSPDAKISDTVKKGEN